MNGCIHFRHGAEQELTTGTLYFTRSIISCSSRLFDGWTIWLTAEKGCRPLRMPGIMGGGIFGDLASHSSSWLSGPRVQGGKYADHAGLAMRQCQRRMGDDEKRRADDRQS